MMMKFSGNQKRKKNILVWTIIFALFLGLVIAKNIFKLENRLNNDNTSLKKYETREFSISLPNKLVIENDTTFLDDGEILNIIKGMGGSMKRNMKSTFYSLSIVNYNKDIISPDAYCIDTLRKNISGTFDANSNINSFNITETNINGINGLKYKVKKGDKFETYSLFPNKNTVFIITMIGVDTLDNIYDEIVNSFKIK